MTYVVALSDNLYILTVDETNVNNLFEDNFFEVCHADNSYPVTT